MEPSELPTKQLSPMKLKIKVTRKDGSIRDTEIMYDRNTGLWCFVNLTSSHVCKCRFESQEEAVLDLLHDDFVERFEIHKIYEEPTT